MPRPTQVVSLAKDKEFFMTLLRHAETNLQEPKELRKWHLEAEPPIEPKIPKDIPISAAQALGIKTNRKQE